MSKQNKTTILQILFVFAIMVCFLLFVPYSNGETTWSTGQPEIVPDVVLDSKPYVVHKRIERTKSKKTIVKKFKPWGRPNKSKVFKIIDIEAAKWGASASTLRCLINGESTYRWWIVNGGGYAGLGQFGADAFRRGVTSIGTRKVRYVYKISRPIIYDKKILLMSNAKVVTKRFNKRRAKYTYVKKGWLPRNPARTHGWVQVRIMARSIAGLGRVNYPSEWEVKC